MMLFNNKMNNISVEDATSAPFGFYADFVFADGAIIAASFFVYMVAYIHIILSYLSRAVNILTEKLNKNVLPQCCN